MLKSAVLQMQLETQKTELQQTIVDAKGAFHQAQQATAQVGCPLAEVFEAPVLLACSSQSGCSRHQRRCLSDMASTAAKGGAHGASCLEQCHVLPD